MWQEEIEKKGITNVVEFDKGKRSIVYQGEYQGEKVIIKTKHPKSTAIARMEIEAQWLQILNRHSIGPIFLFGGTNYLVYKKIEGVLILDYIESANSAESKTILGKLMDICYAMDVLGINKEEMHHPIKHVFVKDNTVRMIDFERCNRSLQPHNVTQLCQFVTSSKMTQLITNNGININKETIMERAKSYKDVLKKFHFDKNNENTIENDAKLHAKYKELRKSLSF